MSLDDGDSLRLSDKFAFFRGLKTDKSSGRRDVPLNDLVTLLNDPLVLSNFGASQAEVDNLKTNLAINTLNDVIVEGRTVFEMVDQVADGFTDETGIDTGASIAASYNAAGDYYEPTQPSSADILLHCDGTDGSTSFTDSTGTYTVTASGDAQVDTAQSKFGGASALFDGAGDTLTVPDNANWNFGAGDFIVDLWVRPTSTATRQTIINHWGTNVGWAVDMLVGGSIRGLVDGTTWWTDTVTTLTAGTWAHLAITRSGTNLRVFIDGVESAIVASPGAPSDFSGPLTIASGSPGADFDGHIDEIRIIKGTGVTTFPIPSSAYSLDPENMTLISEGFTADTAPTYARLTVLFDPVDVVTINTDLIFSVSIDGGSTFATATMEYVQDYTADIRILTCDEIDLSGITSGTEVVIKAVTANEKDLKIHGWVIQWR